MTDTRSVPEDKKAISKPNIFKRYDLVEELREVMPSPYNSFKLWVGLGFKQKKDKPRNDQKHPWYFKVREENTASRATLASNIIRLFQEWQPKTRWAKIPNKTKDKLLSVILSKEATGFKNFYYITPDEIMAAKADIAELLVILLFLNEFDLHQCNLGIDANKKIIKIDNEYCFASLFSHLESEHHFRIALDDLKNLTRVPHYKDRYYYDSLELRWLEKWFHIFPTFRTRDFTSEDPEFLRGTFRGILKVMLFTDEYIQAIASSYLQKNDIDIIKNILIFRRNMIENAAQQWDEFARYLFTENAQQDYQTIKNRYKTFVTMGKYVLSAEIPDLENQLDTRYEKIKSEFPPDQISRAIHLCAAQKQWQLAARIFNARDVNIGHDTIKLIAEEKQIDFFQMILRAKHIFDKLPHDTILLLACMLINFIKFDQAKNFLNQHNKFNDQKNLINDRKLFPIHEILEAKQIDLELISELNKHGITLGRVNEAKKTELDIALEQKHTPSVRYLIMYHSQKFPDDKIYSAFDFLIDEKIHETFDEKIDRQLKLLRHVFKPYSWCQHYQYSQFILKILWQATNPNQVLTIVEKVERWEDQKKIINIITCPCPCFGPKWRGKDVSNDWVNFIESAKRKILSLVTTANHFDRDEKVLAFLKAPTTFTANYFSNDHTLANECLKFPKDPPIPPPRIAFE